MFFKKRKDEMPRCRPEDDVIVTEVNPIDGDLHVVGVYKGTVYQTRVWVYSISGNPIADLADHITYAKRLIVDKHRYQEWQRGMQKAVSSYPVAGR